MSHKAKRAPHLDLNRRCGGALSAGPSHNHAEPGVEDTAALLLPLTPAVLYVLQPRWTPPEADGEPCGPPETQRWAAESPPASS